MRMTSSPLLCLGLASLLLPVTVSDSSIFSLPLGAGRGGGGGGAGEEGAEFPLYNSSKGVNITIPANYSRHSLPSGALTRVNIGKLNRRDLTITPDICFGEHINC